MLSIVFRMSGLGFAAIIEGSGVVVNGESNEHEMETRGLREYVGLKV